MTLNLAHAELGTCGDWNTMPRTHAFHLMSRVLLPCLLLHIYVACTRSSEPSTQGSAGQADKQPAAQTATAQPAAEPATEGETYTDEDSGLSVTVLDKRAGELQFALSVKADQPECNLALRGLAKEKKGDLEIRDDDEGNAHPAVEYVYASEACGISIALMALPPEDDEQPLAWVSTFDCELIKAGCPQFSHTILTIQ